MEMRGAVRVRCAGDGGRFSLCQWTISISNQLSCVFLSSVEKTTADGRPKRTALIRPRGSCLTANLHHDLAALLSHARPPPLPHRYIPITATSFQPDRGEFTRGRFPPRPVPVPFFLRLPSLPRLSPGVLGQKGEGQGGPVADRRRCPGEEAASPVCPESPQGRHHHGQRFHKLYRDM